jgi:hypothetical protein
LEQSPSFHDARITEESQVHEKLDPDTVKFQMSALYVPRRTPEAQPRTVETKAAKNKEDRHDR